MAALPADIIGDILSRLPVKSLLRFKTVCKSWYSLIYSPNFIKLHLNQTLISNSNLHLLLFDTSFKCADFDFNHRNNHRLTFSELRHPLGPHRVNFHGSCNGIICISDNNSRIFLFNPLTKSHRKLPFNPIPNLKYYVMMFGFGFDPKSDDYKVLRIIQEYKNRLMCYNEAKVYSLNDDSWKFVEGISYNVFDTSCYGVLVNQGLHYIVFDEKQDFPPSKFIARFDLGTERFSYFDCPDYNDDKFRSKDILHSLTELGGYLCHIVIYYTSNFDHILHPDNEWRQVCDTMMCRGDVWIMKEYGKTESWVKLFSIRQSEPVWCGIVLNPIVYSEGGRRVLLQIDNLWFCWYDLETKNVEKFTVYGLVNEPFETGVFAGSLVSVDDKLHSPSGKESLPRKNKKNDLDKFLSVGFKLRL